MVAHLENTFGHLLLLIVIHLMVTLARAQELVQHFRVSYHHLLTMSTFVSLVLPQSHCGMVGIVHQPAHVAPSTILRGSASSGVARTQPMPGHSVGTLLRLRRT